MTSNLQRSFRILPIVLVTATSLLILQGCQNPAPPTTPEQSPAERGLYLVTIMGCNDCHSPKLMDPVLGPVPDSAKLLSGSPAGFPDPQWTPQDMGARNIMATTNMHLSAWAGPWGVSHAANLTPDKETGLGEWTEEAFIQALRTGKHQGQPNGRPIMPPMPWQAFAHTTDADLKAIWAYLRSLPPVHNEVPLPVTPQADAGGMKQ